MWGAALSAHQAEGNNTLNDWWQFEQENPEIVVSGRAVDHYRRFREDFKLAGQLGHNAHRLSLEWSRIQPEEGRWDEDALAHYREVLKELRGLGLKSLVTLHHFTNPLWLAKRGGWTRRKTADLFIRYTQVVCDRLGELVDFWITVNEPLVYATQAYWHRRWPPRKKNPWAVWRVVRNMAAAHGRAYRIIHDKYPDARVGVAKNLIAYRSGGLKDYCFNRYFLNLTAGDSDFIGVNYYFAPLDKKWNGPRSDLNWPIYPSGLKQVLLEAKDYGLPLYVTENGLADADDSRRPDFIRGHLRAVERAQAEGADVRGYLHWSLLDNFEWDLGFAPRFGLVEVDYKTMERQVRPSAWVYKAIIEAAKSPMYTS